MKDYNTQKIEYPDLTEYLKRLKALAEYDFSNSSYDDIYNKFYDYALTIPLLNGKFNFEKFNGFKLYRVRIEKSISKYEDMNSIQTYSYPPSSLCSSNGRANIKNKPVFYCTDHPYPAIKECNVEVGDTGFLSVWEVSSSRDLAYTCCLPEVLPITNRWREYGTHHHNFLIDRQRNEDSNLLKHKISLRKLITDKFMNEEPPYSISSMLANEYLYNSEIDILIYPSAKTYQDYTNIAIHPNVVNNRIKCSKILKFKVASVEKEKVTFQFGLTGIVTSNDRIKWQKFKDQDGLALGVKKI